MAVLASARAASGRPRSRSRPTSADWPALAQLNTVFLSGLAYRYDQDPLDTSTTGIESIEAVDYDTFRYKFGAFGASGFFGTVAERLPERLDRYRR